MSSYTSREIKTVLRRILLHLYSDEQGGYPSYTGNGQWNFTAVDLPVDADDLNVLFAFVGVEPTAVTPKGTCTTCAFSVDGTPRGYVLPCVECIRPLMSHWKPIQDN